MLLSEVADQMKQRACELRSGDSTKALLLNWAKHTLHWYKKAKALEEQAGLAKKAKEYCSQIQDELRSILAESQRTSDGVLLETTTLKSWFSKLGDVALFKSEPVERRRLDMIQLLEERMRRTNVQGSVALTKQEVQGLIQLLS